MCVYDLKLILMVVAFVAVVYAQSYAPAADYKPEYKPSYASGRVKMQVSNAGVMKKRKRAAAADSAGCFNTLHFENMFLWASISCTY